MSPSNSGGARSRNLGGNLRGNTHFGGGAQDRISRNLPSPSLPKIFDPLDFFPYIFSEIFSRTFLIFSRPLKIVPAYQNFSRTYQKFFLDLPKIFPRPTKNVIFLATFHKFLQFCLSNSDVLTTFGHFSQTSPLCRCGSYTHGSQRLMVSIEIIKNWGAKMGGQKNNFGGHLPPLAPPLPSNMYTFCQTINYKFTIGWQRNQLIIHLISLFTS